MNTQYIEILIGQPCDIDSNFKAIWGGLERECPWSELLTFAKSEGKVLRSKSLSWVCTHKGMELK